MYLESSFHAIRADEAAAVVSRQIPQPTDISHFPTSWLQNVAIFINFFFPSLALLVVALRVYCRIRQRNFGWGEYRPPSAILDRFAHFMP